MQSKPDFPASALTLSQRQSRSAKENPFHLISAAASIQFFEPHRRESSAWVHEASRSQKTSMGFRPGAAPSHRLDGGSASLDRNGQIVRPFSESTSTVRRHNDRI